jgi:hypothetical protein
VIAVLVTLLAIPAVRATVAANRVTCSRVSKNLLTAVIAQQATVDRVMGWLLVRLAMKLPTRVMKSIVMMWAVENSHLANG